MLLASIFQAFWEQRYLDEGRKRREENAVLLSRDQIIGSGFFLLSSSFMTVHKKRSVGGWVHAWALAGLIKTEKFGEAYLDCLIDCYDIYIYFLFSARSPLALGCGLLVIVVVAASNAIVGA